VLACPSLRLVHTPGHPMGVVVPPADGSGPHSPAGRSGTCRLFRSLPVSSMSAAEVVRVPPVAG
jgi:hypothetical protein